MERPRLIYAALLLAFIAAVALWRLDLFLAAGEATWLRLSRGGPSRWKLVGEVLLFGGILLAALRLIPARVEPRRDATIALLASLGGFLAETWGTHAGLWTYYTREKPPLWIVPAWTLGALAIDRLAARAERELGPRLAPEMRRAAYWTLCALILAVAFAFALPRASLAVLGPLAGLAALLALRPEPERDLWPLAVGLGAVFFADLWGVTNHCWRYHIQSAGRPLGAVGGILFGMCFDSAVVLLCLRAARNLGPRDQRS